MHYTLRMFRNACVALVLACCAPLALAVTVPLHGSISISEQVIPVGATECDLIGLVSGTGVLAPLGPVTLASTDCINVEADGLYTFGSTAIVLTTATGERLLATYSGTLSPTAIPGTYTISGGFAILGGTGRFAKVSGGGGTIQGHEAIDPFAGMGTGQVQLRGTLSF